MAERTDHLNRLDLCKDSTSSFFKPVGPLRTGNCTLHHLGVVVASISAVAEEFAALLSASWGGEIIYDPLQRVRVAFFNPFDARNPIFELIEPAGEDSPV